MPSSYTALYLHIVFSTKNRIPPITTNMQDRLYEYIGGIVRNERGRLLAAGGMPDHVHLLASLHAQTAVADLLRIIKTNSSKWVHQTFANMRQFAWQDGYGAFSVSCSNLEQTRRYVGNQREHHRRRSFQEEFIELLERHRIQYDERYIWT